MKPLTFWKCFAFVVTWRGCDSFVAAVGLFAMAYLAEIIIVCIDP